MRQVVGMLLLAAGVAFVSAGNAPRRSQRSETPKLFAILYERGPNWAAGIPLQKQAGFEGHARHIQTLSEKGIGAEPLASAGEITGGLIVLRAGNAAEAAKFAQGDPFISGKVMTPRVFEWHVRSLKECF